MSDTQKIDPFDVTDLVDATVLLTDTGTLVKSTETKGIQPQIATVVEPDAPKSTEPSN